MLKLKERASWLRRETGNLSHANGGYHYGGSFSCIEILLALYDVILGSADRFILSKGHACWPYYVLLREKGFAPKLEGHPTRDPHNGVWCSTGSEGHGFPIGIGMALAKKLKSESGKIYVLMGDGECQEGTTWESLLIAAKYKLENLIVIVDWNGCQGSGRVADILPIDCLPQVAEAAGWDVRIVTKGHEQSHLVDTCLDGELTKPRLIIAHTIKGKGISFMENKPEWHSKWPSEEQLQQMRRELAEDSE